MIRDAKEFVFLRTSDDPLLYQRATQEEAPIEVWREVIERYPDMKQWVVHNKTVPTILLDELAEDEDDNIRFCVAMKRKLSFDTFEKLARDENPSVRERIAWNDKTPIPILQLLTQDSEERIAKRAQERLAMD